MVFAKILIFQVLEGVKGEKISIIIDFSLSHFISQEW